MRTVSREFVEEVIDFAPSEAARRMGFAQSQTEGTVAAFNMLARNRVAYLADEVGMGKTYIALGVWSVLRHLEQKARVMVIAPRENIQHKWVKELKNFVRHNWRIEDNSVRGLNGKPAHPYALCASLDQLAQAVVRQDRSDLFLRMTTFSVAVRQAEGRKRLRNRLRPHLPWLPRRFLRHKNPYEFRDALGRCLNALLPPVDLLQPEQGKRGVAGHS